MSRFQAEPALPLRPYAHCYWGVERDLSAVGGFTVTPDRFLELIFFVDPPWVEDAAGPRRQLPACTLIPLLARPLRLTADRVVRCAAVRWHAWAGALLFPLADAPDQDQPWYDVSAACAGFAPAVHAALARGAWEEVRPCFDAALPRLLAAAGRPPVPSSALAAVRTFVAPPGTATADTIHEVAARQGRSRRQLERQVRALTRSSPKQLSSLARFEFVRDTLWTQPDVDLAGLAFQAGYADQAHLTRQFRRYSGQAPREFLRDCARLKAFVRVQDVAFVQDGSREAGEGAGE